jgi:hypothetical protein
MGKVADAQGWRRIAPAKLPCVLTWRIVPTWAAFLIVSAFTLAALTLPPWAESSDASETDQTPSLIYNIKKTVVFLGNIDQEGTVTFKATGFLIGVQNVFHIVTARHVVVDRETGALDDRGLYVFFNSKAGKVNYSAIARIKQTYEVNWIFHEKAEVDIAVIPFALDPKSDDVRVIPDSLFEPSSSIFELCDVFFPCYQPGTLTEPLISPVMRAGMISRVNEDRTFYIDGSAFPGNSGSPVFVKPSAARLDIMVLGGDPLGGKFIGMIGEYIPYQEIAISTQTLHPRVIFEENTGLSKVWSVEFIEEIFESDAFKEQLNRIREK